MKECPYMKARAFYWLGEQSQGVFATCTHPEHQKRWHHPEEDFHGQKLPTEEPVAFCSLDDCPVKEK